VSASCLPALSCTVPNTSAPPGATSLSLAAMVGGHGRWTLFPQRWPRSSDHEFFSTIFERRGDEPRPALFGKIPGRHPLARRDGRRGGRGLGRFGRDLALSKFGPGHGKRHDLFHFWLALLVDIDRLDCPPPFDVSLNILRFHQILRQNEPFHTFLQFSPIHLIPCY
jgi:hypothetical protein